MSLGLWKWWPITPATSTSWHRLTTTEQCRPGALRLHHSKVSGFWGAGMGSYQFPKPCGKFEYVSHGKHRTTRTALSGWGCIQGPKILGDAGQDAGTWPLAGKGIIPLISPADELKKFLENYAIMPLLRRSRFKDRNLVWFFPGKEVLKTIFGLRWSRLPNNFR